MLYFTINIFIEASAYATRWNGKNILHMKRNSFKFFSFMIDGITDSLFLWF